MYLPVILVFGAAMLICLAVTPVAGALARRLGLVDNPDGRRKLHGRPIPVAGGLGVLIASCLALSGALAFPSPLQEPLRSELPGLTGMFIGCLVLAIVGLLDDYRGIRGRHKLLAQLIAVSIVVASGVVVPNFRVFQWNVDLGLLAIPFTAFLLLGAVNSLNLIDGLDGLLTSVSLIICIALACMATYLAVHAEFLISDLWVGACVSAALAGALAGFLPFNFPPASIFLGNSGSMMVGLAIGTLAIQSTLKGPAAAALAAPLAVLTIPILDTLAAIIRRKLTGRSIYTTDRGHLHHRLLQKGFSARLVLAVISLFCFVTVGGALISVTFNNEWFAVVTALAVVGILIVSRLFGNAELQLVVDRIGSTLTSFFHLGQSRRPQQWAIHIQGKSDWKDLWERLVSRAMALDLRAVCLNVDAPSVHEGYHARWDCMKESSAEVSHRWKLEIPLVADDQIVGRVEFLGIRHDGEIWTQLTDLVQELKALEDDVSVQVSTEPALIMGELDSVAEDDSLHTPLPTRVL